jgi:hypothetical protein
MGGLIIRYAIAQVQKEVDGAFEDNGTFPPSILVEDVVTMGTPHGGARFASACVVNCNTQVQQMKPGSELLLDLEEYAWNPQGTGGTQWSTLGSGDDNSVSDHRAAATDSDRYPIHMYMGSCHKVWYGPESNVEHQGFRGFDGNDVPRDPFLQAEPTAEAWVRHCGQDYFNYYDLGTGGARWPVRYADLAVRYPDW